MALLVLHNMGGFSHVKELWRINLSSLPPSSLMCKFMQQEL